MRSHVIDLLLIKIGLTFNPSSAPATVAADFSNGMKQEGMTTQHVPLSLLQSNQERRKQESFLQGPEVPSPKTFDQQYLEVIYYE